MRCAAFCVQAPLHTCSQQLVSWCQLGLRCCTSNHSLLAALWLAAVAAGTEQKLLLLHWCGPLLLPSPQVRKYSGGMKRRLSVAISFIGDPLVVYLDEPSTVGGMMCISGWARVFRDSRGVSGWWCACPSHAQGRACCPQAVVLALGAGWSCCEASSVASNATHANLPTCPPCALSMERSMAVLTPLFPRLVCRAWTPPRAKTCGPW